MRERARYAYLPFSQVILCYLRQVIQEKEFNNKKRYVSFLFKAGQGHILLLELLYPLKNNSSSMHLPNLYCTWKQSLKGSICYAYFCLTFED